MKESKAKERFDEILAEMRDTDRNKALRGHLGTMRSVVQELQDAGMETSLTVRTTDCQSAITVDKNAIPLVNGTIQVDALAVDFVFTQAGYYSMNFVAHCCGREIADQYLGTPGERTYSYSHCDDFPKFFRDMLLKAAAQQEMTREFNVGSRPRTDIDKPFPIALPLKLKKANPP